MHNLGTGNRPERQPALAFAALLLSVLALAELGCTRAQYRERADGQTYEILEQKRQDPRWDVPSLDITPDPRSRFFDPYDLDRPPLPPDDPTAHEYMHRVYGMRGWGHWHDFGDLDTVENPDWTTYMGAPPRCTPDSPLPELKKVSLTDAVELGLIHSRDYQEELEDVYLASLALTFQRYRFDIRPIGFLGEPGTELFYQSQPDDLSAVTMGPTNVGISKLMPTGAQFVTELTNNTIWLFSGGGSTQTASTLAYSLVQPLMAGAGREIVLERLTQSERTALYALRDFARFRKSFYVTIVTGERAIPLPGSGGGGELAFLIRGERSPTVGFYFLMFQLQRLRNEESNVRSLEAQVRELEILAEAGRATSLDFTQLQSSLENGRARVLSRRRRFHDELDRFKVQLGLPPDMEIEIDDALLEPFQFINPTLTELERKVRMFVEHVAPLEENSNQEKLAETLAGFESLQDEIAEVFVSMESEFGQFEETLPERLRVMRESDGKQLTRSIAEDRRRFEEVQSRFEGSRERIGELTKEAQEKQKWTAEELKQRAMELTLMREALLRMVREINGIQITLRVELINLEPVFMGPAMAVATALESRLDLMNRRAVVVDSRRVVELAADRLEATVDLVADGALRTPPLLENDRPFNFRATESEFRVGVAVKTPLDRRRERNEFRAAQISYQRARRNYMAAEDQVKLDVRAQLRMVQAQAAAFEVNRRALRVAARELDQAIEFGERPTEDGQPGGAQGVNISRALDNILNAQDELIETWVDYEIARLSFFRDLGTMQIDASGRWTTQDPIDSHWLEEVPGKGGEEIPSPQGMVSEQTEP